MSTFIFQKTLQFLQKINVLLNEQGKVCNIKVYLASNIHKSIIALNMHNRWWVTTWKKDHSHHSLPEKKGYNT